MVMATCSFVATTRNRKITQIRLFTALDPPKTAAKWGAGPAVMHVEGLPARWRGGEGWGRGNLAGQTAGAAPCRGPPPALFVPALLGMLI